MIVKWTNFLFLAFYLLSCSSFKLKLDDRSHIVVYEFEKINYNDYCLKNNYLIVNSKCYLLKEKIIKPFSKQFNDSTYNIDFTYNLKSKRNGLFTMIGNNNLYISEKFPNKMFLCFRLKGNFFFKNSFHKMSDIDGFSEFLIKNYDLKFNKIAVLKKIHYTKKLNTFDLENFFLDKINKNNYPVIICGEDKP